jgi:hypothetical protein
MIRLDPSTTALVLVDLQNGIVGMPLAPRSGADTLAGAKASRCDFAPPRPRSSS